MAEAGPSKRKFKSRVRDYPSSSEEEVVDDSPDEVFDDSSDDDSDVSDEDLSEEWQPSNEQPDISLGLGISLCTMLKGKPKFRHKEEFVQLICREVLETLKFNELNGIVHGSVNPCNIWLYPGGQVRLYKPRRNVRQHRAYRAPEAREYGSSREAEIWSLGVLALRMICGGPPDNFPGVKEVTDAERADMRTFLQETVPTLVPRVRDFLQMCLDEDPSERKTAEELIRSPWMQGVKYDAAEELGMWVKMFPVNKFPRNCTCEKTPMRQATKVRDAKGKPVRQWKKERFLKETEKQLYRDFKKKFKCSHRTYEQNAPKFDPFRRKWMKYIRDKNQKALNNMQTMSRCEDDPDLMRRWVNAMKQKMYRRRTSAAGVKGKALYKQEKKAHDRFDYMYNIPAPAVGGSSQQANSAKVDPLAHLNQKWKSQRSKVTPQDVVVRRKKLQDSENYERNTKKGANGKRKREDDNNSDEEDTPKKRRV